MAELELELRGGVGEIPREQWNALVAGESPFLEWEWLASLEEAGCVGEQTGWAPRPLLLREAGELIAACPLYLKGHSEGEFDTARLVLWLSCTASSHFVSSSAIALVVVTDGKTRVLLPQQPLTL